MEYKDIDDNHFISSDGNVYARPRQGTKGGVLPQRISTTGYFFVDIWEGNKRKHIFIHRIVAQSFIRNPRKLPQVNHKDGNKLNNQISNLEWCTSGENVSHAWKTGLQNRVASTGHKYIYQDKKTKNYRVIISLIGKEKRRFKRTQTLQEAIIIRDKAMKSL